MNTNGKQMAISVYIEVDSTPASDLYTTQAGNNSRGLSEMSSIFKNIVIDSSKKDIIGGHMFNLAV